MSLGELKERHDAVLLTIGAWWSKPMGIACEEDERVVDAVGFLRRVNAGERPEMPETVVAVGGEITHRGMRSAPDRDEEERTGAVMNILEANAGEASMMARCAGKTRLHDIEPEDLRSVTRATAATGIPLAGTRAAQAASCRNGRVTTPAREAMYPASAPPNRLREE